MCEIISLPLHEDDGEAPGLPGPGGRGPPPSLHKTKTHLIPWPPPALQTRPPRQPQAALRGEGAGKGHQANEGKVLGAASMSATIK